MPQRRVPDAETQAFYEDFGELVRRARGTMSQAALGHRVGMSRGSISNIEAGRQHVPLHLLSRLAVALGANPMDFLPQLDLTHDVDVTGLAADERHFVANVIARAKGAHVDVEG
jgi:transcriptional regulator with XRE-family HTH domain